MIDDDEAPSPHQLHDEPQLAIVAAVAQVSAIAEHALIAAHPMLATEDGPDDRDEAAWCAGRLIAQLLALEELIALYRRTLGNPRGGSAAEPASSNSSGFR